MCAYTHRINSSSSSIFSSISRSRQLSSRPNSTPSPTPNFRFVKTCCCSSSSASSPSYCWERRVEHTANSSTVVSSVCMTHIYFPCFSFHFFALCADGRRRHYYSLSIIVYRYEDGFGQPSHTRDPVLTNRYIAHTKILISLSIESRFIHTSEHAAALCTVIHI